MSNFERNTKVHVKIHHYYPDAFIFQHDNVYWFMNVVMNNFSDRQVKCFPVMRFD